LDSATIEELCEALKRRCSALVLFATYDDPAAVNKRGGYQIATSGDRFKQMGLAKLLHDGLSRRILDSIDREGQA